MIAKLPLPNVDSSPPHKSEARRKAHHNFLERKRRITLKKSFDKLKKVVPQLSNKEFTSRAQVLEGAADFIESLERSNVSYHSIIGDMEQHNARLREQIETLEKAKKRGLIDMAAVNACKPT